MIDGLDAAALVRDIASTQPLVFPATNATESANVALPRRYTLDETGLHYHPLAKNDEPPPTPIRLAATFEVVAETCDESGHNWGALLRWKDRERRQHQWAMPKRMVHNDGNAIASELEDAGLCCSAGKLEHELLKRFFSEVMAKERVRCVTRAGWHIMENGPVFVLPSGDCFSAAGAAQGLVLQSGSAGSVSAFGEAGTLVEWQREIAALAVGNCRLALMLSAAFVGPLLDIAGGQSGGLNLVGKSQSGKTTAIRIAGSVWGRGDEFGQVRTWRATANGLEGTAAECTDTLLILDELSQADPREVAEIVYLLANQTGKGRADRSGGARRRLTWRLIFLSTGEIPLGAKLGEVGRRPMAGQMVRMIDVPADAGAELGVFENLHGRQDAAALADHLREATRRNYGTAGRTFVTELVEGRARCPTALRDFLDGQCEKFMTANLPIGADGQVRSVAARFALIAAAGELARVYGVLPWPEDEAQRAAGTCFTAWLSARGGAGAAEDTQAVDAVRAFIAAHGSSRFATVSSIDSTLGDEKVINRAGWRRRADAGWEYLITPPVWKEEVLRGLDPQRAADVLRRRGFLLGASDRHRAVSVNIPGYGRMRLYCVSGTILGDDGEA